MLRSANWRRLYSAKESGGKLLKEWRELRVYGIALLIALASRLWILLAILFAARFTTPSSGEGHWNINSSWYHYLFRWDSGWYLRIFHEGYNYDGNDMVQQPVVFFPLYPLAGRFVQALTGAQHASLLIVSNFSFLIAILLCFKLIKDEYGTNIAFYVILLLSFFPTALFFSAGYTESLTLLFICGFFLCLKRERYLLAAVCSGLATATRFPSIVLLLPLWWEMWNHFSPDRRKQIWSLVAHTLVATSGLWLFMLYLWRTFQHPLAFMTNQRAWTTGSTLGNIFRALTLQPFKHLKYIFIDGPNPNTLDPWFFAFFLFLIIYFRKHLRTSDLLYALCALLLPYLTRTGGGVEFQSMTRYLLLVFPAFILLARLCQGRAWLGLCLIGLWAALLFKYTTMFAQWYWAG